MPTNGRRAVAASGQGSVDSASHVDWTWSRHGHEARFDRVFVRDAQNGAKAERQAIARLSDLWPALSDHVALHAVFVRRPGASEMYVVVTIKVTLITFKAA